MLFRCNSKTVTTLFNSDTFCSEGCLLIPIMIINYYTISLKLDMMLIEHWKKHITSEFHFRQNIPSRIICQFSKMGKFKKGNNYGFKPKYVPHNKGKLHEKKENSPAPFTRVDRETLQLVTHPPSLCEEQEMMLRPGCHRLLRPRPLKKEGNHETLNQAESSG